MKQMIKQVSQNVFLGSSNEKQLNLSKFSISWANVSSVEGSLYICLPLKIISINFSINNFKQIISNK